MTKITIEFQDKNSTEFKVDAVGLTHRQLLVLARELREGDVTESLLEDIPIIKVESGEFVKVTKCIKRWQIQLVADEFYLAAQHQFFAIQNQAIMQARQVNQIAIAKLQQGGRGNSGLVFPGGGRMTKCDGWSIAAHSVDKTIPVSIRTCTCCGRIITLQLCDDCTRDIKQDAHANIVDEENNET